MSTPVLRLGFIGLGQAVNRMFRQYPDIEKLPYAIAGAADPRTHALEKFRSDFNGETYTDAADLCRSPNVDVIYIATPPEMHRAHVELAAKHGKHIVVEKPMALTIEDCDAIVAAAEKAGVKLLAGHTHSFDAPIRRMRDIITSGQIGDLVMINTWNYNEFNPRPWTTSELKTTFGPILNQAPHQVDIVRQLGGGMVKSVRAQTIPDPVRGVEGGWVCFLEFEDRVPATLVYDARGYFDTSELFGWIAEGGTARDPETNFVMHRNFKQLAGKGSDEMERILEAQKEQGRYGAENVDPALWELWGYGDSGGEKHQPFFGLTIASCQRGAIRQSADGLLVYDAERKSEVLLQHEMRGRAAELMDLYEAVVHNKPIFHDGRWAKATVEVCLAILESARTRRDVEMKHQVPMPVLTPAGAS
jgi:phthalate 4,5-cis-dihydrodiol dehydrogenase